MSDFPTTLRVIAAYKAGEDLAERLATAVSVQQAMSEALLKAADEIERLRNGAVAGCETVHQEPVAWANFYPDEEFVDFDRGCVEKCSDEGEVFPLYRVPQTCPHVRGTVTQHCSLNFTLTAEEREAIYRAEARLRTAYVPDDETAATLRKLLERMK